MLYNVREYEHIIMWNHDTALEKKKKWRGWWGGGGTYKLYGNDVLLLNINNFAYLFDINHNLNLNNSICNIN